MLRRPQLEHSPCWYCWLLHTKIGCLSAKLIIALPPAARQWRSSQTSIRISGGLTAPLCLTFCLACTVSQCIQQQGEVTAFSLLIILWKLSRNFVDRSREKHGNTNRTTLGCARTAIKQIVIVSFMGIFFSSPQLDQERRRKHSPKFLYLYLHVDLAWAPFHLGDVIVPEYSSHQSI